MENRPNDTWEFVTEGEMTKSIKQGKTAVTLPEWQGQIEACRESGTSAGAAVILFGVAAGFG